jgi:threonine synthase
MTTVDAANVHNIAIDGTFDDCQDLVKALFADETFRTEMRLSAVNSINFGRIMAQVAYYVWAYLRLDRSPFSVAVPTGNFGNAYAAYVASAMGIPIESIIVGNNANHGVSRLITSGSLSIQDVVPTIAPAMDIAVPSNFERLLFDILGRDAQLLASTMTDFRERGVLNIPAAEMAGVTSLFRSAWMADSAIEGYMGELYRTHGVIVDPHTAIGIAAARMRADLANTPLVAVATAHPAKFADTVERATGVTPDSPAALAGIADLPERYASLPADLAAVEAHIRSVTRKT